MCPIIHYIMLDPVVAGDNNTYERSAIERWFVEHDTYPLTNERAEGEAGRALRVNKPLAAMLQRRREEKRRKMQKTVENGKVRAYPSP